MKKKIKNLSGVGKVLFSYHCLVCIENLPGGQNIFCLKIRQTDIPEGVGIGTKCLPSDGNAVDTFVLIFEGSG